MLDDFFDLPLHISSIQKNSASPSFLLLLKENPLLPQIVPLEDIF